MSQEEWINGLCCGEKMGHQRMVMAQVSSESLGQATK